MLCPELREMRVFRNGGNSEHPLLCSMVESSLLLTGVVNRRCQQLDTPRNCQNSDCPGGDD